MIGTQRTFHQDSREDTPKYSTKFLSFELCFQKYRITMQKPRD